MVTMVVIGYARVSTDKQADQGVSLDAQAEKIRAMAVVHGAQLLDMVQNGGESAKTLQNRPSLQRGAEAGGPTAGAGCDRRQVGIG